MAYHTVIMAGFGGQGVMLIGNLLAQAGMEQGLHVTFIPVYGAEMRGGTANCTVVVSDAPIGSPIVKHPQAVIVMNQPSLEKFQPRLHSDGVQIVNASLIEQASLDPARRTVYIPVNDMANGLGAPKMANMIALGAYLKATGCLPLEAAIAALERVIPSHYKRLIPQNTEALHAGYAFSA